MMTEAKKPKKPALDRGQLRLDSRFQEAGDMARFAGKPEGERFEALLARAMVQPEVRGASVIQRLDEATDLNAVSDELRIQVAAVRGGDMGRAEAMLLSQSHALDALFSNLARRACGNMGAGHLAATETYFKLALRAQNQCRATLESLAELKNPRPVAFVKQANITTGPQQINNNGIPAQGNFQSEQNELSGEAYELPANTGTPSLEGATYSAVEALGTLDRAKVRAG